MSKQRSAFMLPAQQNIKTHLSKVPSLITVYDTKTAQFRYHPDMSVYFGVTPTEEPLWLFLEQNNITDAADANEIREVILSLNENNSVFFKEYLFGGKCIHLLTFTYTDGRVTVLIRKTDVNCHAELMGRKDELTGLVLRNEFCARIETINAQNPDTPYALFFFDIIRFKAINDLYGFSEGDALLAFIADKLKTMPLPILAVTRDSADRFAFLADISASDAESIINALVGEIKQYHLPLEPNLNVGVYIVPKSEESGRSMLDKAMLAQAAIKGNYTKTINVYTEQLWHEMISEQEISGKMGIALSEHQFVVYYQPQYNHSTGMLVGAEALVRWLHPEKGMISPAKFIPIFEKNGFITVLDFYVFEKAAAFIRRSMDRNFSIVPISVNFSKHDIFSPNFVETLEEIRLKYDVPPKYLRIEITESVLVGNNKTVNDVLHKLHGAGYIVEMDDFGSGYSSLNVLKDLNFDIIKLDMMFLEGKGSTGRGGTILASVVNMAKWLDIPVIAEGVETAEQADFLRSIGCDYIQGFLYSKPLSEAEYESLICQSYIGSLIPQMNLRETLHSANFWEPDSQETLIFSNFVGAATIFNYDQDTKTLEILRVNKKYLRELGMNLSEYDIIHKDPIGMMDEYNAAVYFSMLDRAAETGEEQEC